MRAPQGATAWERYSCRSSPDCKDVSSEGSLSHLRFLSLWGAPRHSRQNMWAPQGESPMITE
eukprot:1949656-Pyramimonas_sp.AAC.1